ncbi:hypothetical protein Bca4012_023679 [Brassica carinata]
MVRSELGRRISLFGAEMAPAAMICRRGCSMIPTLETIFEEKSDDSKVILRQGHRLLLLVPAIISAVSCVLLYRHDRVVRFS